MTQDNELIMHLLHTISYATCQRPWPGCSKSMACRHLRRYSVFKDAGAEVLGISSDTPETNAQFAKAQRLPFPLLSDTGSEFRKSLGVSGDLFGLLPGRQARPPEGLACAG